MRAPYLLAERDNPLRRHLLVSSVLAKHIPVRPIVARRAGEALAGEVSLELARLGAADAPIVVVGMAETATGLSERVAAALSASWSTHSTRFVDARESAWIGFEEAHSHGKEHMLLQGAIDEEHRHGAALVLVDDEMTTGRTLLHLVAELSEHCTFKAIVFASLIDARSAHTRSRLRDDVHPGVPCSAVALERLDADELAREVETFLGASAKLEGPGSPESRLGAEATDGALATTLELVQIGSRGPARRRSAAGRSRVDRAAVLADLGEIARIASTRLVERGLGPTDKILVLGAEEFQYEAQLLADALDCAGAFGGIWTSATTRSPGVVRNVAGYGLRDAVMYTVDPTEPADTGRRFAYNVGGVTVGEGADREAFDAILVCADATTSALASGPNSLGAALSSQTRHLLGVSWC